MITKWALHNFKSARKPVKLAFAPLTLFAGANSSGKSTLIQSILLVAQTFASKVPTRQCVLNGNLVSLGTFSDLKSSDSALPDIDIGWECKPLGAASRSPDGLVFPRRLGVYGAEKPSLSAVSCAVSFRPDPAAAELSGLQPVPWRMSLYATTRDKEAVHSCSVHRASEAEVAAKRASLIQEGAPDTVMASLAYNMELDADSAGQVRTEFPSAEPAGCFFHHFLPRYVGARLHVGQEFSGFVHQTFRDVLRPRRPRILMFEDLPVPEQLLALLRRHVPGIDSLLGIEPTLPGLGQPSKGSTISFKEWLGRFRGLPYQERQSLRNKLRSMSKELQQAVPAFEVSTIAPVPLPTELSLGAEYLSEFFSNRVKYLGPLRDEPKAIYPRGLNPDPSDVGLRGEYTAAVLELHRKRPVKYMTPSQFEQSAIIEGGSEVPLARAVTEWLQYLGVARSFRTMDMGRHGHELRVAPQKGREYDLTHVGVGLSQVLPLLVSALLAERDSVLIFEQPELHLHPKVQTRLADFFLSMALLDKQCIIETHSEYLVNQLRLRMAATELPSIASASKVYFVSNAGAGSEYRDVAINKYGAVLDWPDDFFDQSQRQSEEILMAAARKRQQEKQR